MVVSVDGIFFQRIFCDACGTIQPVAPAPNDKTSVHLLCGVCHLVIATLHTEDAEGLE